MALASVALGTVGACSLIGDLGATQCASDTDCVALGLDPPGNYVCEESVCVLRDDGERQCASSAECYDPKSQVKAVCRPDTHTCVEIIPTQPGTPCEVVGYDPDHEGPYFVVGVLAPVAAELIKDFLARPTVQSAVTALDEAGLVADSFVAQMGQRPKMLALLCDSSRQTDAAAYLKFMVDDLGVQAIVTEQPAADLAESYDEVPGLRERLVIATRASDEALYEADPDDMLFHLVGPDVALAEAYDALFEAAKTRLGKASPSVLVITPPIAPPIVDEVLAAASAAGLAASTVSYTVSIGVADPYPQINDFANGMKAQSPDIVVSLVGQAGISTLILTYEQMLGSAPPPVYLMDMGGRYSQDLALPDLANQKVLVGRLFGAEHFTDAGVYETYAAEVAAVDTETIPLGYNLMSDAFMMLGAAAYRVSARGTGDPMVASDLRDALAELDDGTEEIVVDKKTFNDAKALLEGDAGIAFRGTSGRVRWSAEGDRDQMGVTAYCLSDGDPGAAFRFGVPVGEVLTRCPTLSGPQ